MTPPDFDRIARETYEKDCDCERANDAVLVIRAALVDAYNAALELTAVELETNTQCGGFDCQIERVAASWVRSKKLTPPT